YAYTVTDGNNCESAETSFSVEVYATPTAPKVEDMKFCENASDKPSLPVSGAGDFADYTINWTEQPNADLTKLGSGSHIYKYTVTDGNNCVSAETSFTVDVYATPIAPEDNSFIYCQESDVELTDLADSLRNTYQAGVATDYTINVAATSTTDKYTYTITSDKGCAITGDVIVNRHAKPTVPAMSVKNFCYGVGGSIVNEPADKSGYTWTNNKNLNNEWPDVSTTAAAGDYSYSYIYTDANGCVSDKTDVAYTVYAKPAALNLSVADFCYGTGGALPTVPNALEWTAGKAPDVSASASVGKHSYEYKYTETYADGVTCVSVPETLKYEVHDLPTLTAELTQGGKNVTTTVCPSDGGYLVITATVSNFSSGLTYGFSHGTANGNTTTLDNECSSADKTVTVTAYHQATSALVCTNSVEVNVDVDYADAPTLTCVKDQPTKYTITSGCSIDVDFTAPEYTSCKADAKKTFVLQDANGGKILDKSDWDTKSHSLAPGSYKAIFTVNDVCLGENNKCEREFTVVDGVAPVIDGVSDITEISCDGNPVSKTINLTVTDNCAATLTLKVNGGAANNVTIGTGGKVSYKGTFPVGTTTLTWTATDGVATDVKTQTVTVTDGRPSNTALSLDVCDLDKYSNADAETYISAQFNGYALTMGAASDNTEGTVRTYGFTLAHEASASCAYDGMLTVTEGKPESLLELEMTVCYIKDNSAEQAKAFIEEKVAGAYTVGNVSTSDGGKIYTYSLTSTGSGTQCSYEGVLAVKEYDKPTLPAMSVADFCYGVGGSIVNEPADKSGYTWT
ncbi:MAG: hypothetical protein U0L74_02555, partial [Paludibacteraceae bacterium]|nr:hypothetical protein [Paludibacteraceae bacterium]